jgi:hypothetical protein|tara:strand:- start:187 stop:717 length:531 start_codon:yes stop_codon:yes gene_type:complete
MSGIISDNVGRSSGLVKAAGGGGKIGQVLSAMKLDTQSFSSISWVDISDLSVTITPTAISSKIFWQYYFVGASTTNYGLSKIAYGDNSDLTTASIHESAGSRIRGTSGWGYTSGGDLTTVHAIAGLDSPATTSATTYKVQWWQHGGTFYVGRPVTWVDNSSTFASIGSITVMEVLA